MALRYEVDGGVAAITLDRPEVLNAFDDELGAATLGAVQEAAGERSVRCIVITGAGRAFSSGEDLAALSEAYERGEAPELDRILNRRYNPLIRAVRGAPKPVVAALNGVAAGAGASLALACDLRIASEAAKLVLPFAKVGLVPDSGALWYLTRMVGVSNAWRIAGLGDALDATQAAQMGLFHRVVPADEFDGAWRAFAAELARGATLALALTKDLIARSGERSLEDELEAEMDAQARAGRSRDHLEGVRAFRAKRAPRFDGR